MFPLRAILILAAVCMAASLKLAADQDSKDSKESHAVISGTVFREPGFALPRAAVTLRPESGKLLKSMTDSRGEFAFRVPAKPMRYTISVSAEGFRPQEKLVVIQGEDRSDHFFSLESEGK